MIHDDYFQRLPRQLANIQRQLDTRTFFGGDSPSYADFSMFHHCDNILTAEPGAMDGYDGLQAWMARMQALPRLKYALGCSVAHSVVFNPPPHPLWALCDDKMPMRVFVVFVSAPCGRAVKGIAGAL